MKSRSSKFAASACLLTALAVPIGVLANRPKPYPDRKPTKMAEPSSLVLSAVGLALGMGILAVGMRRKQGSSAA